MNELTRGRRAAFDDRRSATWHLMCECPDDGCDSMLEVAARDLEVVRADDSLFIFAREHLGGAELVRALTGAVVVRLAPDGAT